MNIPYVFKKCNSCNRWLVANKLNFTKNNDGKFHLHSKCKKCSKEYRRVNKEKLLKKRKQYYMENKDEILNRKKIYYQNNKENILEKSKERYKTLDPIKMAKYRKEYNEKNKTELREKKKIFYSNHREEILKKHKEYYQENKERIIEYEKQYRINNKDKIQNYYDLNPDKVINKSHKKRFTAENYDGGITKEQYIEMMEYFDYRCAYSGILLEKNTKSIDHIIPVKNNGQHKIWNLVPMLRTCNKNKRSNIMEKWYKEQDFYSEERLQKIYEWQQYAYNKWGNKK